ncbi:oligosaccharide repeat unit polymerase [Acinetobacter sp. CFCC 10889]|uniref:oligosaccharide repeat unit polymerase n=1 Tax=Acinetobacter sp. CFCC 10889 TaxID=1775557 RepID=UPI000DCF8F1B|nr:oligosaccharide repeat unit polymerase [Acinetobacter sp. CFCC 10889]
MKFNIFYFLLAFYFIVNTVFFIIGLSSEYVVVEFDFFSINKSDLIFAYFVQLFVFLTIFLSYFLISKSNVDSKKIFYIGDGWAFFLLIWQVLFCFFNYYYGVNLAGVYGGKPNLILNYLFIFLPADVIFLVLSIHIKSNKFFILNNIFYLFSNLIRGWMSAPLIFVILFFIRKGSIKFEVKNLMMIFGVVLCLLFLTPFLFELKWIARSNSLYSGVINNVLDRGYLESLSLTLNYIFSRFQHIYHVALLSQKTDFFYMLYQSGKILPYWSEGLLQNVVIKLLNINVGDTLGLNVAKNIFSSQEEWSANAGLSGWIFVLQEKFVFFYAYILFILLIPFYMAKKYLGNKSLMLMGVFSIFYLFHGWIGSYLSLVIFLMLIIFFNRVTFKR